MDLRGKGQELATGIVQLTSATITAEQFKDKFGTAMYEIVNVNFVKPMQAKLLTKSVDDPELRADIEIFKNRYSLFCAAFK